MQIILAGVLGFCMGVRRAREIAFETRPAPGERVFTLGPLVHNPRVLENLKNRGIEEINELPPDLSDCSLIIRAHGISPVTEKELRSKGAKIIDATCPKVKKSQVLARELALAGYGVFLAGEANHAEIEGILGFASVAKPPFCTVVGNAKEARIAARKLYKKNKNVKTALLGQTTISKKEYDEIGDSIKKYFPNLEIADTICAATTERQQALRELLEKADAVIIAGGRESANTRRLLAIAKENGKPCALAETAAEIPSGFFKFDKVGISAGASTPDCVIEEIKKALMRGL